MIFDGSDRPMPLGQYPSTTGEPPVTYRTELEAAFLRHLQLDRSVVSLRSEPIGMLFNDGRRNAMFAPTVEAVFMRSSSSPKREGVCRPKAIMFEVATQFRLRSGQDRERPILHAARAHFRSLDRHLVVVSDRYVNGLNQCAERFLHRHLLHRPQAIDEWFVREALLRSGDGDATLGAVRKSARIMGMRADAFLPTVAYLIRLGVIVIDPRASIDDRLPLCMNSND